MNPQHAPFCRRGAIVGMLAMLTIIEFSWERAQARVAHYYPQAIHHFEQEVQPREAIGNL